MTKTSGLPERRRTLLYLLILAGATALLAGLVELFALGQLGPGPYFNVALGSSVLIVSVLFLVPNPISPAPASGPEAGSGDLPDPLTGRTPPIAVAGPQEPSAHLRSPAAGPLGSSPSFSPGPPGALAQTGTDPAPHRPWQVRPLPADLGGGFTLPRNPEGVLATLDRLAEELTKPIPGLPPHEPGPPGVEPSLPAPAPVDEEDLARPVVPARSPPDSPPGTDQTTNGNGPLRLPTEEELLRAIPGFTELRPDGIPDPEKAGGGESLEERSLRAGLEGFRRALPVPPGHAPRRPRSPSSRSGRGSSSTYRAHGPTAASGETPLPDPLGSPDPHVSEEDLQGMLSALEQRLRSGTSPSPPSTPVLRRPWDPSPD